MVRVYGDWKSCVLVLLSYTCNGRLFDIYFLPIPAFICEDTFKVLEVSVSSGILVKYASTYNTT